MNIADIPVSNPIIHPKIFGFLAKKELIFNLLQKHGSPLHLLFPQIIKENIDNFKSFYKENHLSGQIFYAHKANRTFEIIKYIVNNNIGIEVSSEDELDNAIKANFPSKKVIANGPKNAKYLKKALEFNCFIGVDSIVELKKVLTSNQKRKIIVRLSNFVDTQIKIRNYISRFGIDYSQVNDLKKILLENKEKIEILGLSFHIDSISDSEKQIAIKSLLKLAIDFINAGISVKIIDIGGGFRINYVKDKNQWENLIWKIQQAVLENKDYLWNYHNFGFYVVNNRIRGEGNFYPYYSPKKSTSYLDSLLNFYIDEFSQTAKKLLSDLMIDLFIEPGRAMLDQAGITLMSIIEVEEKEKFIKVIVDGNYKNITADQDIMIDPVLIQKHQSPAPKKPVFIFGNLCLENDVIFRRQLTFPATPQEEDVFAFINTAAYKMDFSENQFIHHKLPKRLIIEDNGTDYVINLTQ